MQQLQEKFKSVLDKMADLTDEKQQLEHLVMQLQSETETIGECQIYNLKPVNRAKDEKFLTAVFIPVF